jgi:hypothetical protein
VIGLALVLLETELRPEESLQDGGQIVAEVLGGDGLHDGSQCRDAQIEAGREGHGTVGAGTLDPPLTIEVLEVALRLAERHRPDRRVELVALGPLRVPASELHLPGRPPPALGVVDLDLTHLVRQLRKSLDVGHGGEDLVGTDT